MVNIDHTSMFKSKAKAPTDRYFQDLTDKKDDKV